MSGRLSLLLFYCAFLLGGCKPGEVAPPRTDLAASQLTGPVASCESSRYEFPHSSKQMDAVLADPAGWSSDGDLAAEIAGEIKKSTYVVKYDGRGWADSIAVQWPELGGGTMLQQRERGEPASRVEVKVTLMPAPGGAAKPFSLGSGATTYYADGTVKTVIGGGKYGFEQVDGWDEGGRKLYTESSHRNAEGTTERTRIDYSAYDDARRVLRGVENRNGVRRDMTHRYFQPDAHGNMRRELVLYTDSSKLGTAPVAAELWIQNCRYRDETR